MARPTPALEPGRNCWRIARADRASVIVDAADYFRVARTAMTDATHQILLIGWDFDARIKLVHDDATADEVPVSVGHFIDWLVAHTPTLHFNILRWDVGAIKSVFRGKTIFTIARWMAHDRITLKLDGAHPTGASHHQKIVVIDDCLAFCGGIDMTDDRWDTRAHDDDAPERIQPDGKPYDPWHDATTAIAGPAAAALGDLSRARWARAGGTPLPVPPATDACWPEGLEVDFDDVDLAISRTVPEMDGVTPAHEIEQLYCDLIARAERWIYAESQYFASRRVAEAIARRLDEPDGPEIVILNPVTAEGWLEPIAMDSARARLMEALRRRDAHGRLRLYHPMTAGGTPIYVHAKIMIVDGEILRVGSSNFNNRSMRLDTECDVTIDATRKGNAHAAPAIARIAHELLAEHLGVAPETIAARFAETGSLIATIESLRGAGKTVQPYEIPDLGEVEAWLADHEVLDPEGPDAMFEAPTARGLFRHLRGGSSGKPRRTAPIALAAVGAAGLAGLAIWRSTRKR
ncbi:phospholipase D-like domain-containing protein [Hephaestia sp. GCM10023244]|uniref:phospholipase D-like domain-containing protein n=1 Tax=unclassified Hephaestia TaxID=2631281 RepID=UPI002077253C|nr:phospholipase D-like domain-containing protein [Hephaestia sp. MAHUQ-44]MCM8730785.1 phospholipase D-like domain-containing protein [Hephaestia sp. MAHUQ-44]